MGNVLEITVTKHLDVKIMMYKELIWLAILTLLGLALYRLLINSKRSAEFEIDEAEIGIGSHKMKIRPNYDDVQIAYKIWVELSTRKIGVLIDFNSDVIEEIYNSWYEFFKLTRELIKDIPVRKIRNYESTKQLVNLAIEVLNLGIRPHLTSWQAKFRKWYKIQSEDHDNQNLSPQDLQKRFPEYDKLAEDLQKVNQMLIRYKDYMRKIAFNER